MSFSSQVKLCFLTGAIMSSGFVLPAHAQQYPAFSGDVSFELQNDYTADSDDQSTDEYNNLWGCPR